MICSSLLLRLIQSVSDRVHRAITVVVQQGYLMEVLEKDNILSSFFCFPPKRVGCAIKIPFKQTGEFIMLQRICSLFLSILCSLFTQILF